MTVSLLDDKRGMPQQERLGFLLWSRSADHRALVARTVLELEGLASRFHRPYVAVSAGKDSTVCLHLALQAWDPAQVLVWYWDYGSWLMPRPYHRECLDIITHVIGDLGSRFRVDVRPGGRESREDCATGYRAFFGAIRRMVDEEGRDFGLTGMRSSEGKRRAQRLAQGPIETGHNPCPLAHPLRDWRAADVWAYLVSRDLPHHSTYDTRAVLSGYASERTRLVTFFDGEFARFGSPGVDGLFSWRFRGSPD